jgi:hypothetical protein
VKNEQISVFTFMHCAETREQAIASRAAESALWFLNAAPGVFQVPRSPVDRRDPRRSPEQRPARYAQRRARPTSRRRSISTTRTR